jgi:hypothetical protein
MDGQEGAGRNLDPGGDEPSKERRPVIDDLDLTVPEVVEAATVGRLLRGERERQGLGLDQIEANTHIRATQLRALEDDRFDALPAEAYARGFVRTYADLLGCDADQMVHLFNEQWRDTHSAGDR